MTIGQKIRHAREKRGMTHRALSEASGVSHGYISIIENSEDEKISVDILKKLAAALIVSPVYFLTDDAREPNWKTGAA